MNVLMYPIMPEDDFPEMFCAIRPFDGEHQFYAPEGEPVNELLWSMDREVSDSKEIIKNLAESNLKLRVDNTMLLELCDELIDLAKAVKADSRRLAELERHARNLGVEVDG